MYLWTYVQKCMPCKLPTYMYTYMHTYITWMYACMHVICVCMYIYTCLPTYRLMYVCLHTYLNVHIDIAYMHTHTYIHAYKHTYIDTNVCVICVFMSPCTHVLDYARLPIYMYTYMYIHTIYSYKDFVSAEQKANRLSGYKNTIVKYTKNYLQ